MKYSEIRLVEQDKKKKPKTLRDVILDQYEGENVVGLFASYTVVDKVGINPRSGYNTPLGIYCYPLEYVIAQFKSQNDVPYMGKTPYVHIFRATRPERELDIHNYNQSAQDSDIEKLKAYFVDQENITDENVFADIVQDAKYTALRKTRSGELWNITKTLSEKLATGELKESFISEGMNLLSEDLLTEWQDASQASRSVVVWNGIFRNILGYDYANDWNHSSTIHSNEPTQAVFFSKPALQVVDRLENKNEVAYKMSLIDKIGHGDKADPTVVRNKRIREYEKLIAQNINNPNILDYQLGKYLKYIRSPKLQRSVLRANPMLIDRFSNNNINSDTIKVARRKFVKNLKRGQSSDKQLENFFKTLKNSPGEIRSFFSIVNTGKPWPELESALLDLFKKTPALELVNLANRYVQLIKKERWPEFEKYIFNSPQLELYIDTTGAEFEKLNNGDTVKILSGTNTGKQGKASPADPSLGNFMYLYLVTDDETSFGYYTIAQLEKIKDADPADVDQTADTDDNDDEIDVDLSVLQDVEEGDFIKVQNAKGIYAFLNDKVGEVKSTSGDKATVDLNDYGYVSGIPKSYLVINNKPKAESPVDKEKLKELIDKGKITGYVTYKELNTVLPPDKVTSDQIEDVISMISEIGIDIVEDDPEPQKPAAKKTKGPTGPKIGKFIAKAQGKGGDISQAELDAFLPPGTIKDDILKNILELLKDSGITVDGKPIEVNAEKPEMPTVHSDKFKPYDGEKNLSPKEQNAWEQIMIKSMNDSVVKPLLNKAFNNHVLNNKEFYTLAKNIDFPYWVAGKYLGMAGVKVDNSLAAAQYKKNNPA